MITLEKIFSKDSFSLINWVNALLLGAVLAIIILLFAPFPLEKYEVEFTNRWDQRFYWFEDLEGDGQKEKLGMGENHDGSLYLYLFDEQDELLGQFNLEHGSPAYKDFIKPYSLDITGDGIRELHFFSQKQDSLYLNIFDYHNMQMLQQSRFICTIGKGDGKVDLVSNWLGSYDVNRDAVPEVYFAISGLYSHTPRRVFRYDYAEDSLISSLNTGSPMLWGDLKEIEDQFCLMVCGSGRGNIPADDPVPYHDSCSWVFGFDEDLHFLFEPITFSHYPSTTDVRLIGNYAYVICSEHRAGKNANYVLMLSPGGSVKDKISSEEELRAKMLRLSVKRDSVYYYMNYKETDIHYLNPSSSGRIPKRFDRVLEHQTLHDQGDFNQDGTIEYLLFDIRHAGVTFYPEGIFRAAIEFNTLSSQVYSGSVNYYQDHKRGEIALIGTKGSEFYEYSLNPLFKLRVLFWFLVYLASFLFVSLVMFLQRRSMKRQQQLEHEVANLHLLNLRNQLDPHFTFNALNSVGNAIYQENKEKAYDLFQRFTRLIRSSLDVSQEVFRPLNEEIRFTTDYLEFQKTRFRDLFQYEIEVDPSVDVSETLIPKMLIQGFAENATKHAFYGIDYMGHIQVSINRLGEVVQIEIDDNGIGISSSREQKTTSGLQKGQKLLKEQVRQINKLYKRSISIQIIDKSTLNDRESGTTVKILLR